MDSSTFPCSPAQSSALTHNHEARGATYPVPQSSPFHPEWPAQFRQSHASTKVSGLLSGKETRYNTRLVVFAFSSGVFSSLLCAVRIRRSHSSTKAKMLFSYSVWNLAKIGSLGLASRAARNSVFNRSVCDFGHAPRSIFWNKEGTISKARDYKPRRSHGISE
jgi:hypothetical protein